MAPTITGGAYFDIDVSVISDLLHPVTEEQYFIVTFDDRPSNLTDAFVSICADGAWHGMEELQVSEHADRTPNQNNLVIGSSSEYFMLGYTEDDVLHLTTIQPVDDRMGIVERREVALGSDVAPESLGFVTKQTSMATPPRGYLLWSQDTGSSRDILAAYAEAPTGARAAAWNYCYGTPNSPGDRGFITVHGSRQPNQPHTLRVEQRCLFSSRPPEPSRIQRLRPSEFWRGARSPR